MIAIERFLGACYEAFINLYRLQKSNNLVLPLFVSAFYIVLFCYSESMGSAQHSLFIDSGHAASELTGSFDAPKEARRWRSVSINPVVAGAEGVVKGDVININLFPDRKYTAVVDRITKTGNKTFTVRARIDGHPYGFLMISTSGRMSLGTISIPGRGENYRIRSTIDGYRHYVIEIDEERIDMLKPGDPLTPPPFEQEDTMGKAMMYADEAAPVPEDLAIINVMAVYTSAARRWAQNHGGIDNIIAQAMEKSQMALDNSQVNIELNLVHTGEVQYQESGNSSDDLRRLRETGNGYMDEVHQWRDRYRADLVVLFGVLTDAGGRAYLLNTRYGRPDSAFSIVHVEYASSSFIFMHELGHNFGLNHHKDQNEYPGPTNWIRWPENTWSAGWRWEGRDGHPYCSIMTYESGAYFDDRRYHTAVAHISNPDVLHEGVPTGDRLHGDNARTLREIKHVVAAYRGEVPERGSEENPFVISNASQFARIRENLSSHFRLDSDIDLSGIKTWEPIGTTNAPFTGRFDGAGHIVTNLVIDNGDADCTGMFGYVEGGVIKKIGIENADVKGGVNTGGLVGCAVDIAISEVFVNGFVSGRDNVGGLVGYLDGGYESVILNSYSDGNVDGETGAGGLVGHLGPNAVIESSYAAGSVRGDTKTGGLVAYNEDNGNENVVNSFWCIDTGPPTSEGGTGRAITDMMERETYTHWDFHNIWNISTDAIYPYPYLRWQVAPQIDLDNDNDNDDDDDDDDGQVKGSSTDGGCFIDILGYGR